MAIPAWTVGQVRLTAWLLMVIEAERIALGDVVHMASGCSCRAALQE